MIEAWHFVGATLRDGRPIPADGKWLVHTDPVEICVSGLHASRRPWHALQYAPGSTLCRVECADIVAEQDDKLVCRRRRIIERADVADALRYFARMYALSVIHLCDDPPDVVLDYLMTGDESIRDTAWVAASSGARATKWAAASCAASSAARYAARYAAWNAAWNAARTTPREAAWAAAWDAARATTREAAWAAADRDFDALIYEGFGL